MSPFDQAWTWIHIFYLEKICECSRLIKIWIIDDSCKKGFFRSKIFRFQMSERSKWIIFRTPLGSGILGCRSIWYSSQSFWHDWPKCGQFLIQKSWENHMKKPLKMINSRLRVLLASLQKLKLDLVRRFPNGLLLCVLRFTYGLDL